MRSGKRCRASSGSNGRVTFTGEIADAELRRLMQTCAAFVLPSVTRAEAFGYVQLEAMAAGKPVISTDVPSGVSWVNQDGRTGIVVKAGDAAALAAALTMLAADAAMRARLGAAGRAVASIRTLRSSACASGCATLRRGVRLPPRLACPVSDR